MTALSRRAVIASATLGLPGMGAWAQSTRLRCFWWGNPDRDRRTRALLEAYSKSNNIQLAAESLGWATTGPSSPPRWPAETRPT